MNISVIGLGYVGLPLALQISKKGFNVIGVDKNEELNDSIRNKSINSNDPFVIESIKEYSLPVQTNIQSSDIYIVCVPTPINKKNLPDLKYVIAAVEEIAQNLKNEQTIIIESTIYPGVCEEIVMPILEKTKKKYYLAHCPERINPGDPHWFVGNIPRVVGGIDELSTSKTISFYESFINAKIVGLSQIKAAEATKILENTFRDINIAFVNEMAQSFYRMGININEVIKGASTKPFAFMPHYPGIGVGGHCIAVDPYYMIEKGKDYDFNHDFLTLARRINRSMPQFAFEILQQALNEKCLSVKGSKIALLGLSYKADVSDDRESPSYDILKILMKNGANVIIYDPYNIENSTVENLEDACRDVDAIVVATNHTEFIENIHLFKNTKIILDGRNCLDKVFFDENGILYRGIGIV